MSLRNMRALVVWTREQKTGVEPLHNVPENARFIGAITPVMYSGDKKFYPGKILMISEDLDVLDQKADEFAKAIDMPKTNQATNVIQKRPKRTAKNTVDSSVASHRDVAMACGNRPPMPKDLQPVHQTVQKSNREAKAHHALGQNNLDNNVVSSIRKKLFASGGGKKQLFLKQTMRQGTEKSDNENESGDVENEDDENDMSDYENMSEDDNDKLSPSSKEESSKSGAVWCGCHTCNIMQKYDTSFYRNFLREIYSLFEAKGLESQETKSLELLPIPLNNKQVELVSGMGVHISASDKDQLRVDYRNKPSALARETLFTLYGRDAFQMLTVTGRGKKQGSYTIPSTVLRAVCAFVNRNVNSDQQLKTNKLVSLINKRAPEWRKSSPVIKKNQGKNKTSTSVSQIISTSPFKVMPIQTTSLPSSKPVHSSVPVSVVPTSPPWKALSSQSASESGPKEDLAASVTTAASCFSSCIK